MCLVFVIWGCQARGETRIDEILRGPSSFSDSAVVVRGTLSASGVAVPLACGRVLRNLEHGGHRIRALVQPAAHVEQPTVRLYTVKVGRITGLLFGGPVLIDDDSKTRKSR